MAASQWSGEVAGAVKAGWRWRQAAKFRQGDMDLPMVVRVQRDR
jgi:hypothetical protein